jgi:hypothetical protein
MYGFVDAANVRKQKNKCYNLKTRNMISSLRLPASILGKITILKSEIALLPLAPAAFPVEVHIYPLLVLVCDRLGFRVPLEPREILDMEAP